MRTDGSHTHTTVFENKTVFISPALRRYKLNRFHMGIGDYRWLIHFRNACSALDPPPSTRRQHPTPGASWTPLDNTHTHTLAVRHFINPADYPSGTHTSRPSRRSSHSKHTHTHTQTRSMGSNSEYPNGALFKYNTLWRSGMNHAYVFFKVTHTTTKGTVMGMRVTATWMCEQSDNNSSCERWDIGLPRGAVRRMPHPRRWKRVSHQEVKDGVRAVSCVH